MLTRTPRKFENVYDEFSDERKKRERRATKRNEKVVRKSGKLKEIKNGKNSELVETNEKAIIKSERLDEINTQAIELAIEMAETNNFQIKEMKNTMSKMIEMIERLENENQQLKQGFQQAEFILYGANADDHLYAYRQEIVDNWNKTIADK